MPTPKYPKEDEGKEDYIDRCMGDDEMKREAKERGKRYKICLKYYKEGKNNK